MTTLDECPGCGYPKFGPGLCAYCMPVQVLASDLPVDPPQTALPLCSEPVKQAG